MAGTGKRRGPAPGWKKAKAAALAAAAVASVPVPVAAETTPEAQAATAPAAAPATAQDERQAGLGFGNSLERGRRLDLMNEPELRAYARQIGISQRDAEGLSVERLRQNCSAQLYELIDAL